MGSRGAEALSRVRPRRDQIPLLARLRVGTKLMLLVLVPVGALLVFTVLSATSEWRHAQDLQRFRSATTLSFATASLANAVSAERFQAVVIRSVPDVGSTAQLAAARRRVDDALRVATARVAGWHGRLDVAETVDLTRRQVGALRARAAAGNLAPEEADASYSLIVNNLDGTTTTLGAGQPTDASGRAADAYLAILRAIEAAQRERIELALILARPAHRLASAQDPWATVEATELEALRQSATPALIDELDNLLFRPPSLAVQEVRDRLTTDPGTALRGISLSRWLWASGGRIHALQRLDAGAEQRLASTVSRDLSSARANALRDMGLSLAVLLAVGGLGLLLRRSITEPLREVSAGARALSRGDLTGEVGYTGRDEIGDVAAALGELRASADRLAAEIRSMNLAITESRLDHRADVNAVSGTWSQLLAGMNDTMAAFAELHNQEAALRRVATLVARGVPPEEIFRAVVVETRELLGADAARLVQYDGDGGGTVIAANDPGMEVPVGTRLTFDGESVTARVARTGRATSRRGHDQHGSIAALQREQGIRSSVAAPIVVDGRVWGVICAAWRQPPRVSAEPEGRIAQFTELVATAIANAHSSAQLSASRARVVAAADEARRRFERDLHDGVQQRLVSLGLELRDAEAALPAELPEVRVQLQRAVEGLSEAFDELRAVAQGIHPAILSLGGLGPALRALTRRSAVPVELDLEEGVRLSERLEVAIYYVVSEALTNAAKHAQATGLEVRLRADASNVELTVSDDGVGGANLERGSGLVGLADRIESLGGSIQITSPAGRGTTLVVTLPRAVAKPSPPDEASSRRVKLYG